MASPHLDCRRSGDELSDRVAHLEAEVAMLRCAVEGVRSNTKDLVDLLTGTKALGRFTRWLVAVGVGIISIAAAWKNFK